MVDHEAKQLQARGDRRISSREVFRLQSFRVPELMHQSYSSNGF